MFSLFFDQYNKHLNQTIMASYLAKPQVGFLDACKLAVQKCINFKGRARRSEYWWAILGMFIVNLLTSWIPFIGSLISLFITLMSLSLIFRRLHDTNHSGWYAGTSFIVGWAGLAIMFLGAIMGGMSLSDFTEGEAQLAESMSTALAGASIAYIGIGGICLLVSGILGIVLFVFSCLDSEIQTNKYGESPKYYLEEEQPQA